jgi:hypothetical protein
MRTMCSLLFGLSLAVGAEAQFDRSCPEDAENTITGNDQAASSLCGNFQQSEPIVMWDVTGVSFPWGFVHGNLVVYNNGIASVSSLLTGDVRAKALDPAVARKLRKDLAAAGATTLCDPQYWTIDAPLTTLTVLGGSTDAQSHTFSYWGSEGTYAKVQAVIDDFLATHFPGFSLY